MHENKMFQPENIGGLLGVALGTYVNLLLAQPLLTQVGTTCICAVCGVVATHYTRKLLKWLDRQKEEKK